MEGWALTAAGSVVGDMDLRPKRGGRQNLPSTNKSGEDFGGAGGQNRDGATTANVMWQARTRQIVVVGLHKGPHCLHVHHNETARRAMFGGDTDPADGRRSRCCVDPDGMAAGPATSAVACLETPGCKTIYGRSGRRAGSKTALPKSPGQVSEARPVSCSDKQAAMLEGMEDLLAWAQSVLSVEVWAQVANGSKEEKNYQTN